MFAVYPAFLSFLVMMSDTKSSDNKASESRLLCRRISLPLNGSPVQSEGVAAVGRIRPPQAPVLSDRHTYT